LGGAAVAVVPVGGYAMGVDTGTGEDRSAFNFTCACGNGLCANVPKEVGEKLKFNCTCGVQWELEWTGENFKTKMRNPGGENAAEIKLDEPNQIDEMVKQLIEDRVAYRKEHGHD
jgi:hypothetical protein